MVDVRGKSYKAETNRSIFICGLSEHLTTKVVWESNDIKELEETNQKIHCFKKLHVVQVRWSTGHWSAVLPTSCFRTFSTVHVFWRRGSTYKRWLWSTKTVIARHRTWSSGSRYWSLQNTYVVVSNIFIRNWSHLLQKQGKSLHVFLRFLCRRIKNTIGTRQQCIYFFNDYHYCWVKLQTDFNCLRDKLVIELRS